MKWDDPITFLAIVLLVYLIVSLYLELRNLSRLVKEVRKAKRDESEDE